MKCTEIEELLGGYVDGELEPEITLTISEHLRDCESCRAQAEQLRVLTAASQRLPAPEVSEGEWNRMWSTVCLTAERRRHAIRTRWFASAAAVLLVLIGLGGFIATRSGPQGPDCTVEYIESKSPNYNVVCYNGDNGVTAVWLVPAQVSEESEEDSEESI